MSINVIFLSPRHRISPPLVPLFCACFQIGDGGIESMGDFYDARVNAGAFSRTQKLWTLEPLEEGFDDSATMKEISHAVSRDKFAQSTTCRQSAICNTKGSDSKAYACPVAT
jgi:hypothetical protein